MRRPTVKRHLMGDFCVILLSVAIGIGQTTAQPPTLKPETQESNEEKENTTPNREDHIDGLPLTPETTVRPPQNSSQRNSQSRPATQDAPTPDAPPVPIPAQSTPSFTSPSAGTSLGPLPSTANAPQVVTANRSTQAAATVANSLTVISRQAIRNSGQTNLAEVLRTVPGLDVVSLGGAGQQTSLFIRGGNSNHTKVLLDGMPISDASSPSRAFDFSFLTVDQVERIEVLRGPQSSLYGSDAIGGVINIITRKGGPSQSTLRMEGGSFSTSRTALSQSGGNDRIFYSFGGSYTDTNGFSAAGRPPGNVEDDFSRNGTFSGRLGWHISQNVTLDVIARYQDTDAGTDGFTLPTFTFQDDPSSLEQETTFARAQLSWKLFEGTWVQRLGAGYTQYQREAFSPFGGTFYGRTGRLDWQNELQLIDGPQLRWRVISGVDFQEEVSRNATVPQSRQGNLAGYVQTSTDISDRLFLSAGARWDDFSRVGNAFTYNTAGRYVIPKTGTAFHGAIGTGFRAPALDELLGIVGNTALQSESSQGWEAGIQQSLGDRITFDATYFRNDYTDLVVFDFAPAPGFPFGQLQNVNRARTSGVELTSVWRLTDESTVFANYTYTDTLDRTTGQKLLRRARDKWSFGINRTFPKNTANVSLQTLYVGRREGLGETLDDYWQVNLAAWYRLNPCWRLFGRVDNFFDTSFEPAVGYQGTPASFYLGLERTL